MQGCEMTEAIQFSFYFNWHAEDELGGVSYSIMVKKIDCKRYDIIT